MGRTMVYFGNRPFKYYLISIITGNGYEVSEEDFFNVVGTDRRTIPMHYDKENINRQNFFLDSTLIGYRVR